MERFRTVSQVIERLQALERPLCGSAKPREVFGARGERALTPPALSIDASQIQDPFQEEKRR